MRILTYIPCFVRLNLPKVAIIKKIMIEEQKNLECWDNSTEDTGCLCNLQVVRTNDSRNHTFAKNFHSKRYASLFRKILSRGIWTIHSLEPAEISLPMKSQRSSLCSVSQPLAEENAILKITFTLFRKKPEKVGLARYVTSSRLSLKEEKRKKNTLGWPSSRPWPALFRGIRLINLSG